MRVVGGGGVRGGVGVPFCGIHLHASQETGSDGLSYTFHVIFLIMLFEEIGRHVWRDAILTPYFDVLEEVRTSSFDLCPNT